MDTTKQVKKRKAPNPTGIGGFRDHPELRSPGGWKKENTISYQYHRFINMPPDELKAFVKVPDNEKTVAMDIAYRRVVASYKSLADVKEISDRTEGKAVQQMEIKAEIYSIDSILE